MHVHRVLGLEQVLEIMENGIKKLVRNLEESPEKKPFSSEDYMRLYTTIFDACTQDRPPVYSPRLYDYYKQAFVDYVNSMVLPSLREKHGEHMLMELVKRWSNHELMVRWLSHFFDPLDRYYIDGKSLPSLNEVGLSCFRDPVYREMSGKAKDAVIALINSEREGNQIDKALLKNVLAVYVEMGMGKMDCNAKDHSGKFSDWMGPCIQDKLKSGVLRQESDRVAHCLHSCSERKRMEVAQSEEKLVSGGLTAEKLLQVWLKDDEDRSRVYWLYGKVTKELESTRNLCKQCLGDDIIALILLVEDVAMRKMESSAKKRAGKMMTLDVEGSDTSENVKSTIQEEGIASNVECSILPQTQLEEGMTHARRVTLLEASLVPCPKRRRTGF